MPSADTDLGNVIARFRAKRWPWWASIMGIVLGAITILFALDASGRIKSIELVLLGIGTFRSCSRTASVSYFAERAARIPHR